MPFDGARHLGHVAAVIFVAILLSWSSVGCWSVLAAAIALYYLLSFYNALERRDLDDLQESQRRRRHRDRCFKGV